MGGILSVSDEFSTNGTTSIKSSPNNNKCSADCVYLTSNNEIGKKITMEFDTYSTSLCTIIMYYRLNNAGGPATITSTISSPANTTNRITLTLNEIIPNTYSASFRVISNNQQQPVYIDNVQINIQ